MILILFDIHRNISSAQCVIQYTTSKSIHNFEVSILQDNVSFIINADSDSTSCKLSSILLPPNLLNPCSISSLSCTNSKNFTINRTKNSAKWSFSMSDTERKFKINFRFKIIDERVIERCISRNSPTLKFKDFIKDKFDVSRAYSLMCTKCSYCLSEKKISFKSIHEYQEGLSELSETWFCHKHDHGHEPLQPIDNALYIGEVYFYFHNLVVNDLKLSVCQKEYKCPECQSVLSLKRTMNHPSYIGFFCDEIILDNSESILQDAEIHRNYRCDMALLCFGNILEDLLKSSVSCKIYLQSKVGENSECLLLWINSQKVAQFLLHEIDNDNISKENEFNLKEVYKVLYCIPASDSGVTKQWKHDFSVEFFQISDNMMKVLKDLLDKSSKLGVDHEETVKGFSFGYLPAFSYIK